MLRPPVTSALELMIIGDADQPVGFQVQPLKYQGNGISPAVEIEGILVAELSNSGLFYQPWRKPAKTPRSALAWRLLGIRYLISGEINEGDDSMAVNLTIEDTLGGTPTLVYAELNLTAWQRAAQVLSQQLFYSLFYATYTDQSEAHYLNNENRDKSRYLVRLVQTVKSHWHSEVKSGQCRVSVSQFPGGSVQSSTIEKNCDEKLNAEISTLFSDVQNLPYQGFKEQFMRRLRFHFMVVN